MRGISVRSVFAVISLLCAFATGAQTPSADELLRRGRDHFRSGRHTEAVADLGAATQAYLSSDEMQAYVRTGRFEKLPQFETALIYLALSHSKLGNEAEAREAILRLATAERIAPTYASLPLDADAAEFESLAPRLVPDLTLGANVQLARGGLTAPPSSRPLPPPQPPVVVASTDSDRVRLVEQMVAQECARIQREADQQITTARQEAEQRIAAERAAAKREADERVAAAERSAAERIAQIQRTADERVAAAEASARTAIAERTARDRPSERVIVPPPVVVQPPVAVVPTPRPAPAPARPTPREPAAEGEWTAALRRAAEFAAAGRFAEANEIYLHVANGGVSRAVRIQAAVGLYRTGAYRHAADVFAALAPFARGEEDLRYYNAVSLFETGRYGEAQHELSCALPFIEQTDDVIRYRSRIEQMTAWQNALPARVEIQ